MTAETKKAKNISLEQINFFSLNELPDTFDYLEVKLSFKTSTVAIKSDSITMNMESRQVEVEYRARTMGFDVNAKINNM